jgi:insertion element IS1 protein InsB
MRIICIKCKGSQIKKNGHSKYGKQNYQCLECKKQFIGEAKRINVEDKEVIGKLLLERITLRGICRVMGISIRWLLYYIKELYSNLPKELETKPKQVGEYQVYCIKCDEMWSYVGKKKNQQWLWIAMDAISKQIIAFKIGKRTKKNCKALYNSIPMEYREKAIFLTDGADFYQKIIPYSQLVVCKNDSGLTNIVERFNGVLRNRLSRLVRKSISFSKSLNNHIGSISFFISYYNLALSSS